MSNERNSLQPARSALKLSDTQLVLLSAAAQRDDHCLTATQKIKGGAARKVAEKMIAAGLVREIKARIGTPGLALGRRDRSVVRPQTDGGGTASRNSHGRNGTMCAQCSVTRK